MKEPTEISTLEINNSVVTGDWIFDASEIILESSADGNSYTTVVNEKTVDENNGHWEKISNHQFSFDPVNARYFKVTVKCSTMPEWHPGKGNRAYIFVDEIRLN